MRVEARLHRLEHAYVARRLSTLAEGEVAAAIRLIDRFLRDPSWDALSAEEADTLKAVCRLLFIEVS
jgi:hypothetical protein